MKNIEVSSPAAAAPVASTNAGEHLVEVAAEDDDRRGVVDRALAQRGELRVHLLPEGLELALDLGGDGSLDLGGDVGALALIGASLLDGRAATPVGCATD